MFYEGCLQTIFVEMLIGKRHVISGTIYRPPNQHSTKNELFLEKFKNLLNLLNKNTKLYSYRVILTMTY